MMPSPVPPAASAIVTSLPAVSERAVSPRTRAGTSAASDSSGLWGCHSSSRCESRKRSVASMEIELPEISMRTPVSTGSMSSRPAAVTACCTAWAKTSLETVPVAAGMSGRAG